MEMRDGVTSCLFDSIAHVWLGDGSLYLESVSSQQRRTFGMRSERRSCCSELSVCSSLPPHIILFHCISTSHSFLLLLLPLSSRVSFQPFIHRAKRFTSAHSFTQLFFDVALPKSNSIFLFRFPSTISSELHFLLLLYCLCVCFERTESHRCSLSLLLLPLCEYRLTV